MSAMAVTCKQAELEETASATARTTKDACGRVCASGRMACLSCWRLGCVPKWDMLGLSQTAGNHFSAGQ